MQTSTRFLGLDDMSAVGVALLLVVVTGCGGCGSKLPQRPPTIITAQRQSLAELERYLATGDWRIRIRLQEARGQEEIVASRVFAAFSTLVAGIKPNDDHKLVNEAWDELLVNPAVTIAVLKPVVFECTNGFTYVGDGFPPVSVENRRFYFEICVRIAAFELGSNAVQTLSELCADRDTEVAQEARKYLKGALEKNWRTKKAAYQQTKSADILEWFARNVLHSGLSRADVELYLGRGMEAPDFRVEYSGMRGDGRVALRLQFFDNYLVNWDVQPLAEYK